MRLRNTSSDSPWLLEVCRPYIRAVQGPATLTTEIIDNGLPEMSAPDQVMRMESYLLTLPQVDLGATYVVHGAMCARTIFIPAGSVLTGAQMNKTNIMSGDFSVTTNRRRIHT